jgi:hypothetical protein
MREREKTAPPQDKSVETLTSGLSLRVPSGLSLRAPCELNLEVKEGEQSLAREINLRETGEERAKALVPEISLRTVDETLPSQAGTRPLALTTMLNPLALHAPTTTPERLELWQMDQNNTQTPIQTQQVQWQANYS